MNTINPVGAVNPKTWADPADANVVKNGDVASGLYVASADAAGAYCLYSGYPNVSISFPLLPTSASYMEAQVMAPPFCTKAQVCAVGYLNAAIGTDETVYVVVDNVTSGAIGTTSYKIPMPPMGLYDAPGNEVVQHWGFGVGGSSDTGQLLDIAESSDLGIPRQQKLRLKVTNSKLVCTGIIIRWTRDTNTLS